MMSSDPPSESNGHDDTDSMNAESTKSSLPVESEDVGASLPSPEEARAAANVRGNANSSSDSGFGAIFYFAICFLLVTSLVLGLSLGLTGDNRNGAPTPSVRVPAPSPVPAAPSPAPAATRQSTLPEVQKYLADLSISSSLALEQPGSPQYDAARWLAEDDEANLPLPSPFSALDNIDVYLYVARYVMAVLFFALDGENWERSLNFLDPRSVCEWHQQDGFFCDANDVPRAIFIADLDILGMLPSEIGHLTTLQVLSIQSNTGLTGPIPKEMCRMTDLKELEMLDNDLSGSIPDCIGDLENLEKLLLGYNDLDDTLPTQGFCQLTNLREINLQYNALIGELPPCLQDFDNLQSLMVSNNLFQGQFPELGPLFSLSQLVIDDNMFTGDISTMNSLRNIRNLYADGNRFEGDLNAFGTNFPTLESLDLSDNNITSTNGLPPHWMSLPRLTLFDVSGNNIKGAFNPPPVQNARLQWLAVHNNELSGPIPSNLTALLELKHLDVSNNNLNGPMPPSLGMLGVLEYLFLSNNAFEIGPIPTEYESLVYLREFSAKQTNREGQLPDFFADLDSLILLDLSRNDLSGDIPEAWGNMRQISFLLLNENPRLTGSVPPSFEDVNTLRNLFLDGTSISGDLDVICGLPFWDDFNNDGQVVGEVFADCLPGGTVTCTCSGCFCCDPTAGGCSGPKTANLDLIWEEEFARLPHDFEIDEDTRAEARYTFAPTASPNQ